MSINILEAPRARIELRAVRAAGRWTVRIATAIAVSSTLLLAAAVVPTLVGYSASVVTSGSMGRAMPVGSIALAKMVPAREIKVGDVITFRHAAGNTPITHRVISVVPQGGAYVIRTQGDVVAQPDPEPVVLRDSVARVAHVVPLAGYLIRFAHTAVGWVVLFMLPAAGLLYERRRKHTTA